MGSGGYSELVAYTVGATNDSTIAAVKLAADFFKTLNILPLPFR